MSQTYEQELPKQWVDIQTTELTLGCLVSVTTIRGLVLSTTADSTDTGRSSVHNTQRQHIHSQIQSTEPSHTLNLQILFFAFSNNIKIKDRFERDKAYAYLGKLKH